MTRFRDARPTAEQRADPWRPRFAFFASGSARRRSMKKITKAMELVATSRIAKAQARVAASLPYAQAITGVLTALASNARHRPPAAHPASSGAAGRRPARHQ